MNYYDARQRQDDKRWDYTRMNDGVIWPVGYCDSRSPCQCWLDACNQGRILRAGDPGCEKCGGTGRVDNPDYCGSHDTAEEARKCFARYLLDGWREESYGHWMGCEAIIVTALTDDVGGGAGEKREPCDTPTKRGLTTRPPLGHGHALCDEHRTLEHLKALVPAEAGQIVASY